jgi:hypothetical protein
MTLDTRYCYRRRAAAALVLLGAALVVACDGSRKPKLVAELQVDQDYKGAVHTIAFDSSGDVWMATAQTLYKVQDGKPQLVDTVAGKHDEFALAPGGRIYAKLVTGAVQPGLFTVQLVETPKKPLAELRLPDFPFGFGSLYLGGAGQLIVTATPLDSLEGLGGRFLYVFWSSDGRQISTVTLEGLRVGIVDAGGNALLLLGEQDAMALSSEGKQLWKVDGRFRNGALAANGSVALLNPGQKQDISEVRVFSAGKVTSIKMPAAVYEVALAADGSIGAVAIDEGKLFFVSPASCQQSPCGLRAVPPLAVDGTFQITATRFLNPTTLAVGVIQYAGVAPRATFLAGAVLAVDTSGNVLFKANVELEQPATWSPSLDVRYGAPFFGAHTPDRALLVSLGR